jgi:hypothetical protein
MLFNNSTIGGSAASGPTIYPPFQQWADFNANGGAYTNSGATTPCTVSGTDKCYVLKDIISGNNIFNSTSANQPIWYNGASGDGPNSTPYVKFNGTSQYLLTQNAFTATDTIDLWIVMRLDSWVSGAVPIECFTSRNLRCNSASPQIWEITSSLVSNAALGTWQKIHMMYTGLGAGQNYILSYTGTTNFSQSGAAATTTEISIGALFAGTSPCAMSLARVIAWQRPLAATEITTVNTYLNGLYGV